MLNGSGLELWTADYYLENWKTKWLLKSSTDPIARIKSFVQLQAQLVDEFQLLQELAGLTGVTYSVDGELMVPPISIPKGQPLSLVDLSKHSEESERSTPLSAFTAIQGIHRGGATLGGVFENSIYLTDSGEVCVIDV